MIEFWRSREETTGVAELRGRQRCLDAKRISLYGVVELSPEGRVREFAEKPERPLCDLIATAAYIYAGEPYGSDRSLPRGGKLTRPAGEFPRLALYARARLRLRLQGEMARHRQIASSCSKPTSSCAVASDSSRVRHRKGTKTIRSRALAEECRCSSYCFLHVVRLAESPGTSSASAAASAYPECAARSASAAARRLPGRSLRCLECAGRRIAYASARAALLYTGCRPESGRSLEGARSAALAVALAELVAETVPPPRAASAAPACRRSTNGRSRRGFHPARSLALELARIWELPFAPLLERVGSPRRQRGLALSERSRNVASAFVPRAGASTPTRRLFDRRCIHERCHLVGLRERSSQGRLPSRRGDRPGKGCSRTLERGRVRGRTSDCPD